MNKQELIEKYEAVECVVGIVSEKTILKTVLRDLKQLDEPQPVKVKQFVTNWYEENKDDFETSLFQCVYEIFKKRNDNELNEFEKWLIDENTKPFQTLVNMHQFGYEIEKESKYIVKVKATGQCLGKYYINNEILSPRFIYTGRHANSFTRKELEEADFSWVFDCNGVEVQEVE